MEELVYGLKIVNKKNETDDSVTLYFEVGEELIEKFKYVSGQFVTMHLMVDGKFAKRSYSLSSAPYENEFTITIKKIPGGLASGFLVDQVETGKVLPMTPPAGVFTYTPKKMKGKNIVLIAAGSGITPLYSILKSALLDDKNITLIYCNRDQDHIIFKNELNELTKKHPNLKVIHTLSQPKAGWGGLKGRASKNMLKNTFSTVKDKEAHYFMCGPTGLMTSIGDALVELNVDKKFIHKEDFNPILPSLDSNSVSDEVFIGDRTIPVQIGEKLTVVLNDETFEMTPDPDKTILENLIEKGKNPPYSCMDGACMACLAKITSGLVRQDDPGILTEESIEDKEVLTCKAKLASRSVTINYDDLF